jgi:hypothetical protein
MKTELNINDLIDKTQQIVHDGNMEIAVHGEVPIQIMESESGKKYQLSVVMKLI